MGKENSTIHFFLYSFVLCYRLSVSATVSLQMQTRINGDGPWEDWDLDDSDITYLLRPCKRRHSSSPTAETAATKTPTLLDTEQNRLQLQLQPPPLTSSRHNTIPGPAGSVQAAMHRKNLDRENNKNAAMYRENDKGFGSDDPNNGAACTQDYIQRAMETPDFDDDFARHPWISALQFLGAKDGVVQSTPISSLKNCLNAGKAAQVVAVINSSTPSSFGGLGVVLKDPTGTIGASIHHKVLSQTEFGKKLTVGAVLILREVAIFSPVRSAHYLNITQRNLVKVFCQDDESTAELNYCFHAIQYVDSAIEYFGNEKILGKMPTTRNMATEGFKTRQGIRKAENWRNLSVSQIQNLLTGSLQSDSRTSNVDGESPKGLTELIRDTCYEVPNDPTRTRIIDDPQEFMNVSEGGTNVCSAGRSFLNCNSDESRCVGKSSDDVFQGTNGDQMQKQHFKAKASLPCWTDEQLHELFAGDDDD